MASVGLGGGLMTRAKKALGNGYVQLGFSVLTYATVIFGAGVLYNRVTANGEAIRAVQAEMVRSTEGLAKRIECVERVLMQAGRP